jgi:hypothetical protein
MIPVSSSIVCTLFEGHYHFGVAVLTNSLYSQGFRGDIFAGYRGALPAWTGQAYDNSPLLGPAGKTLNVADGLRLHLIPLQTNYHLTNYKPDFMLQVWDGPAKDASSIFYFDPDIVLTAPWKLFNEWVEYGVALCEDVNSPLTQHHPRREAWRRYYRTRDIALEFKVATYANGGYIGLTRSNEKFLQLWKLMQEHMGPAIGGLQRSALPGSGLGPDAESPFAPFGKTDQDALNAAIEAWGGELSIVGKEAMAIAPGTSLLPHAIGHPKPWRWSPLTQAFDGRPPRKVDVEYWNNARGIVTAHSPTLIRQRLLTMKIASLIGRFYRRR